MTTVYRLPTFTATQRRNATSGLPGQTIECRCFGPLSRFCAKLVATRLGYPMIFIADAESIDVVTGLPAIVAQLPEDATHWQRI